MLIYSNYVANLVPGFELVHHNLREVLCVRYNTVSVGTSIYVDWKNIGKAPVIGIPDLGCTHSFVDHSSYVIT